MRRSDLSRCISAALTRFFTISCYSSPVTVALKASFGFARASSLCYRIGTVGLAIAFVASCGMQRSCIRRFETRVSFRVKRIVARLHGSRESFFANLLVATSVKIARLFPLMIARTWSKCGALFLSFPAAGREKKINNLKKIYKLCRFFFVRNNAIYGLINGEDIAETLLIDLGSVLNVQYIQLDIFISSLIKFSCCHSVSFNFKWSKNWDNN